MSKKHCDYAKSDMTPCVIRDGDMCYGGWTPATPRCVGCGRSPEQIGVPAAADYGKTFERYVKKHARK